MEDILKDLLKILGRIVTILPLMLMIALFMGRRSVGELPVFDFLIILSLGAVVGADIADPQINHIHTAFAIIAIGLLQRTYSELCMRNTKFRKMTTFDPVVVIKDGNFLVKNLRSINYSIDNVLELLREEGVFDISEVQLALVESNGRISVYKNPEKSPLTLKDIGISKYKGDIAYPVIVEGCIYRKVLSGLGLNENWLSSQLKEKGIDEFEKVFFASVNDKKELHISKPDNSKSETDITPLYH
ncbi:DUF421 domain-containing protein [Dendrosporobacter sp. 1207_IL3150]|uniref:DUF421 domain-containing protein n=1 Tax=Dendrosporobacter sp. 1207_IL3150 TaxID=3084054 RepID=UPI002FD9F22B